MELRNALGLAKGLTASKKRGQNDRRKMHISSRRFFEGKYPDSDEDVVGQEKLEI
jgi:hypothetical protein